MSYKGSRNKKWKGDKVSYRRLHQWVELNLGKPSECSKCGFTSSNNRRLHWANISHEYKRDLTDWKRLCVRCHKLFDLGESTISTTLIREYCINEQKMVISNLYWRKKQGYVQCRECKEKSVKKSNLRRQFV